MAHIYAKSWQNDNESDNMETPVHKFLSKLSFYFAKNADKFSEVMSRRRLLSASNEELKADVLNFLSVNLNLTEKDVTVTVEPKTYYQGGVEKEGISIDIRLNDLEQDYMKVAEMSRHIVKEYTLSDKYLVGFKNATGMIVGAENPETGQAPLGQRTNPPVSSLKTM